MEESGRDGTEKWSNKLPDSDCDYAYRSKFREVLAQIKMKTKWLNCNCASATPKGTFFFKMRRLSNLTCFGDKKSNLCCIRTLNSKQNCEKNLSHRNPTFRLREEVHLLMNLSIKFHVKHLHMLWMKLGRFVNLLFT
jgi:hypothetical protein